jgi:hypothetical protein
VAEWLYQWVIVAVGWTILLCIIVLLPMVVIRRFRFYGAMGLVYASYVFGVGCWLFSFIVAYKTFGLFWLIVGLLLVGVGVVPVAFIGLIIHGLWDGVLNLVGAVALFAITRLVGMYIASKQEEGTQR